MTLFNENLTSNENQEKFFANINNKSRSIFLLIEKFKAIKIYITQAKNYAEVLIIKVKPMSAKVNKNVTIIIEDDADLLVILTD